MSFILEALRKSEAERRRGHAPDLLSDTLPVAPAARIDTSRRGQLIAIVAAALIALLLVAWALRPTAPAEPAPATAPVPSTSASTSTTAVVAVPAPPASLSPPPARVAATPTVRRPASAPPAAAPPTTAVTATPATAPQTREPRPADDATEPDIDAPAAPTPAATTQPADATVFASPDVPLRLADLSTDERQQLPALKLSMHMWAPAAANRFAIIDGTRVNEGDRIGDATVEAIQQDGVMLNWRGRRIRLPIR